MPFFVTDRDSVARCTSCARHRPVLMCVWGPDWLCGRCFRWAFQWKLSVLDFGLLEGLHRRIADVIVTDGDLV